MSPCRDLVARVIPARHASGARRALSSRMQSEPEDWEDRRHERRCDTTAMRILTEWVARHDGQDPHTGAVIDREFVVLDPQSN